MVVCHGRNRWTQGPLTHLLLRCGGLCPSFWRWAQGPAQCWHSLGMEHVRLSSTVAVSETSPEPGGVFLLLQDTSCLWVWAKVPCDILGTRLD